MKSFDLFRQMMASQTSMHCWLCRRDHSSPIKIELAHSCYFVLAMLSQVGTSMLRSMTPFGCAKIYEHRGRKSESVCICHPEEGPNLFRMDDHQQAGTIRRET